MVGVVGVKPTLSESKSDMLSLHNTPLKWWTVWESNPPITACKAAKNPSSITAHIEELCSIGINALANEEPSILFYQNSSIWCSVTESNSLSPGYKSGASPAKLTEQSWWKRLDLNQRWSPYEGDALPLCYISILKQTMLWKIG